MCYWNRAYLSSLSYNIKLVNAVVKNFEAKTYLKNKNLGKIFILPNEV